jgi:hypothetical protein
MGDEISDYVVHGDELKRIVRLGRRRPMPFAFCPDSGGDVPLFATHRKKPPELIARVTRRDSGQSKVAFGTFVVEGKVMVLTCERVVPEIARKLRRYMRLEKMPLHIRVLDMLGTEIDADIEDDIDDAGTDDCTGDPFGEDKDDDDDDDDDDGAAARRPSGARDAMAQRIEALRPVILAAGGERGERLRDLFSALLRARGDGPGAEMPRLVDRLEDEVASLMNSASRPQGVSPPAPPRRPPPPPPTADAAGQIRLARRVAALRRRVEALQGPAGPRLMAALKIAAEAVRRGDAAAAEDALARIAPAVDRAEAQAQG